MSIFTRSEKRLAMLFISFLEEDYTGEMILEKAIIYA
jgi:hypothetical protein